MTAKDIMTLRPAAGQPAVSGHVDAGTHLIDVLPRLLQDPSLPVEVRDGRMAVGYIDAEAMLKGIARLTAPRDDCSIITVECRPEDYSASMLAHAVEDSDAHLVDLMTAPGDNGNVVVTLRVRQSDPSSAIHNLERYDFKVTDAHGASNADAIVAYDRLLALQTLLNV